MRIYKTLIDIQKSLPLALGNTWKQAPVKLLDASGRVSLLPLETVKSWEVSVPGSPESV